MKRTLFLLLTLPLVGCKPTLQTGVTIPQAMLSLSADMTKAGVLPSTGSTNWTPMQSAKFASIVQASQCEQKNADPLIVQMIGTINLTLNGSYTTSGSFNIGTVMTTPSISLSSAASRTIGQTMTLPVTFTALSSLPEVILGKRVYAINGGQSANNMSSAVQQPVYDGLYADYYDLKGRITKLIQNWTVDKCPQKVGPITPFVGGRYGK